MNKKRFILVVVILAIAISGTIGLSVMLMVGTYRNLYDDFTEKARSALNEAISLEESMRKEKKLNMEIYSNNSLEASAKFSALKAIPSEEIASISLFKNPDDNGVTIMSISLDKKDSLSVSAESDFNTGLFRSFLDELLKARGIEEKHSLTVLRWHHNKNVIPEQNKMCDTICMDTLRILNPVSFSSIAKSEPDIEFQLLIESPNKTLLRKIAGMAISSILIAAVLCLSFIYLLRTIMKMKTIEQMRKDFTHNITHELKTPIAAICAANEALSDFHLSADPDRRLKYLNLQKHSLESLSAMVDRILSLSLQETEEFKLNPETSSLNKIIGEQTASLSLKYGSDIEIETVLPEDEVFIFADRFHFSNVIQNILDNAVKYCNRKPHITVNVTKTNGNVSIKIADNGIGIPDSEKKLIFEKYYRVHTGDTHNVRGFGIGLYYCRLIIERVGGTITVSDAMGGGSVFTINVPTD